jgi:hypothetical protein
VFARLELAVVSGANVTLGISVIAFALIALRVLSNTRPRAAEIDFNEAPATIYQLSIYD